MGESAYDALLLVSFGGPEKCEDVIPFLERVLKGRNVPRERMLDVAEHYYHFDGRSPINDQNRALIRALKDDFDAHGLRLPIYWGNRNWHPLLSDVLARMRNDGVRRALAFVTSAFSSYSGCRQYLENIAAARTETGPGAPEIDKLRVFYNHPGYVQAIADRVRSAIDRLPEERRAEAVLLFTAHSIPVSMTQHCAYEAQFSESSRLVAEAVGRSDFQLVYQSRSGPPTQPWLEPDINDVLAELAGKARDVIVTPIGFVSDHMEVLYDLDTEAAALAGELGLNLVRAGTAGTHPAFVSMVRELVLERINSGAERRAIGALGPSHDICPSDCCLYPAGRPGR